MQCAEDCLSDGARPLIVLTLWNGAFGIEEYFLFFFSVANDTKINQNMLFINLTKLDILIASQHLFHGFYKEKGIEITKCITFFLTFFSPFVAYSISAPQGFGCQRGR